jgi:HEPN domain-containing protein
MNSPTIEARRWFETAQAELDVIRTLRAAGHYAAACFHSQQAAEKALKAMLYSQGMRVVLGHSIGHLARQCETYEPAFAGLTNVAALLDQFYIPTRYPNGLPSPAIPDESYTLPQAAAAQQAAEDLLHLVEAFLRAQTGVLL